MIMVTVAVIAAVTATVTIAVTIAVTATVTIAARFAVTIMIRGHTDVQLRPHRWAARAKQMCS